MMIIEIDKTLPALYGNANRLESMFLNLFQNSIDAHETNNDGAEIRINISQAEQNGGILIRFSDNGEGIDKDHLKMIFDPFFSTKEVGKGTGLGLSIVHGIVQEHRGTIECQSTPCKETVFTINLPVGPNK